MKNSPCDIYVSRDVTADFPRAKKNGAPTKRTVKP